MRYPQHIKKISAHYHTSCKELLSGPWMGQTKKARRMLVWYYRQRVGLGYQEIAKLTGVPAASAHRMVRDTEDQISIKDKFTVKITSDL